MEKEKPNETHYNFTNFDSWKEALDKAPNSKWVLERRLGGSKTSKYIPLFVQQALADIFFRQFDVFDITPVIVSNEIMLVVKIHFIPDYPDAELRTMTGIAAKPIQQDANSVPANFPTGKKSNALEYNAPASRSAAVSNALTSFANIFGRNLNRDVRNDYSMTKKSDKNEE